MAGQPPSSWSANPVTVGFQDNSTITFTYGGTSPNTYYRTRVASDATRIFTATLGNGGTLTQTSTTSGQIIPVGTSGSVTLNSQYSTSPTTGFTTAFSATFTRSAAVQPDVTISIGNYSVLFGNTAALSVSWTGASAPTEYAIWSVTAGAYVAGPTGSGGSSLSIPNANLPASGGATQTYRVDGKVSTANNGTNTYSAGPTFTITRNAEVLPVTGVTLTTSSFTLTHNSTSGVSVSWTGQGALTLYNLFGIELNGILATDAINVGSRFLSYADGDLPPVATTYNYKVIARVSSSNGGSNNYYDGPSFTVTRLAAPDTTITQNVTPSPATGLAYNYAGTVTVDITGCTVGQTYRFRCLETDIFNVTAGSSATSYTGIGLIIPGPGGTITYRAEVSVDGSTWYDCNPADISITKNVVPSPATVSGSTSTSPSASATVTITATGGSGTYLYSSDGGSSLLAGNTFVGTRGQTYTLAAQSSFTYGSSPYYSSFVTSPYEVPYLLPDTTITVGSSPPVNGTIADNDTLNKTVSFSGGSVGTYYRVLKNGTVVGGVAGNGGTQNWTLSYPSELPTVGQRETYTTDAQVFISDGGDSSPVSCTGTNTTFTISRLCTAPVVGTQSYSTSPSASITHSVAVSSAGAGGTLEYAVNQSPSAPTTGWSSTNSFTISRGQNYYFWARQSNPGTPDLTATSASVNETVPYLAPDSDVTLVNTTVAYGDTSFAYTISNGNENTVYEIRSTSYTGTIRDSDQAGGAGNAFFTISAGLPTQTPGNSVTFYVTCYRTTFYGGEGSSGPRTNVGTFTATRDQAPAYSFTDTFDVSPLTEVSTFSQVTGITVPTAVSLIGGGLYTLFSVSSTTTPGTWQAGAATINGNQYLHIKDQSADSPSTDVVVNTRIGTASASVDRSWTIRTADDTMPDDFFFTDVTNADQNTYYTSYVQITGISVQVPITQLTMQGEYGVTSTISPPAVYNNPLSILPNQYIHARILSASSPSTTKNVSLRVGSGLGKTDTFSVTTSAIDTTPDPFFFTDVSPAVRSTDYYTYAQITGINSAAPVSRTAGTTASWATSTSTTQPTSWPNPTTISPNNYLHLKVTSSANYATTLSNTMDVGGVSDAWVVTTAQATSLSPGTVTRSPAGDLVGSYSGNLQVNWTGVANHEYRIYRTSQTPAVLAGPSSLGASTLTVSSPNLPAEGVTSSLQLEVRRPTAQSGDNIWYTTIGGTFTVLRIQEPTVANNQSFDVSTNASSILHPIQLSSNGVGGTLQYNTTTTSPYPSSGWSASNSFLVSRETTYYFWARRSTDTSDYDVSEPLIIPQYTPIGTEVTTGTHGLRVYTSPGSILIDSNSRIGRVLAVGTTASVPAKTNSGNISVPTLDTSSNTHVIVTHPADATDIVDPYVINVNYTNQTFNIYNNTTTAKTYNYFVLRTG